MTTETKPRGAFDLDAILGELTAKPLVYKGVEFELPAEFPAEALAPFLAEDLGLIDIITEALEGADDDAEIVDLVLGVLKKQPKLPLALIDAARKALAILLGGRLDHGEVVGGRYDEFAALLPSVNAYFLIAAGVVKEYGVAFTDFFDSGDSSETETGGTPSSPTSSSTTDSTPATSGDAPETPATSE